MGKYTDHREMEQDILANLDTMIQQIRIQTANTMEDLMGVQYNRGLLSAASQIRAELDRVFTEFNKEEAAENTEDSETSTTSGQTKENLQ